MIDGFTPFVLSDSGRYPDCQLVMSCSLTNQVIVQLESWNEWKSGKYEKKIYVLPKHLDVLPKHLDEKVAALHLKKLGAKRTKLTSEQAAYIRVPVEGSCKPAHYTLLIYILQDSTFLHKH
ncbi:hypothetical protein R1sor_010288 [Riccia sorocarpa]|uniref:Adenosylhomocysteinase n=1 Tax=Riccia sorocarpa TaxID=122646 RepID=A0ABD3HXK7_9MARC